jgi:hypothetical protein
MSISPSVHATAPQTPTGWFALAIPATAISLVVSAFAWSQLGLSWASVSAVVAIGAVGTVLAGRGGRDRLTAFLGGTILTLAAVYLSLLAVAQVSVGVFD